ncbi:MAG: 2-octaprenyl-6-methoxyphenyl hydroxylase [Alphaproteobacteria bacterium]|nr:2-octaprenyl-6-methoxyphenyl hydroxylase [Alphaproteobacteria bacterium]
MPATAAPFNTDVAIVGGGMVGQTLALALAGAGIGVTVLDRAAPETALAPAFDGRASAIAYASTRLLAGVGAWEALAPHAQPILDIRVSDGESPLYLHYSHEELAAGQPFGHLIENRHIRFSLLGAMRRAGVTMRAPVEVTSVAADAFAATVTLGGGETIRARLVVGADGARSFVRSQAGIRSRGWDYPQAGIVLTVEHERDHGGVAHERFLPAGPFAILPLPGQRSSLVWTERRADAAEILKLDEERFLEELRDRFGDFLGEVVPVGPRWSYPLAFHRADSYFAARIVLAGDSAHMLHPLAGQGLNLGLRDAAALAEVIVDASRLGLDFGAADQLARYQRWRRLDAVALIAVTDGLNRLFSNDLAPIRLGRDIGLGLVNRVTPLKRLFVSHARGTAGKLPRLLAGESL